MTIPCDESWRDKNYSKSDMDGGVHLSVLLGWAFRLGDQKPRPQGGETALGRA